MAAVVERAEQIKWWDMLDELVLWEEDALREPKPARA
jgi:hypothetical protein